MGEVGQHAPIAPGKWTLRLDHQAPCDGTDSHQLSMSGRLRLGLVSATTAAFVLVIVANQLAHLGAVVGGLCLGAWLSAGYSMRLRGDTLVLRRYGMTKEVRLEDVAEVQYYRYQNSTSLRLLDRSGKRLGWVSTRALARHPEAAAHLRHWLDRPDVSWGPGAWLFVAPDAAVAGAAQAPASDSDVGGAEQASDPAKPRGRSVKPRPQSRWIRGVTKFSMVMLIFSALVLLILVPVMWSDYALSQRIQHGGEAMATLRSEWVTSSSDRSGTHHTTHFDVTFATASGAVITTQINGPGIFTMFHSGATFPVHYDPSHPASAELPGYPNHRLGSTVVLTMVTAGICVMAALMARNWFRIRRKIRAARSHTTNGVGSSNPRIVYE